MFIQPDNSSFGAFAECGQTTATVGFRDASTGGVIASIIIPAQVIESAVLENASVEITLLGDGEIGSSVAGPASDRFSLRSSVTVDQLVEAFVNSQNLHKEEATVAELATLLKRLHKSVEAVERAIRLFEIEVR
ncbi:hypothetical protein [Bradyrhizobium roseum]|uniref:hypothetical protein n=1 Tax=Bradyrhizobium roseum TaxID=3056648 RepID=UPI0026093C87|nr:hypothetical protein [Bradyrhizobium roseus]WKA29520.1 hypothetical protein QUH67_04805 [Bradyrhizobium roseus]